MSSNTVFLLLELNYTNIVPLIRAYIIHQNTYIKMALTNNYLVKNLMMVTSETCGIRILSY